MSRTDAEWEEWGAEREAEQKAAIGRLISTVFGVGGSCGCDGALDFGCPLCTPKRREAFVAEVEASIEKYR